MPKKPRLSLIVPTRNRSASLERLERSVAKHTKDYELLVIGGDDGYNIKVNRGLAAAKGEYIILMHDDHTVTPHWADVLAEVGSFRYGENKDSFDHYGGYYRPHEGYCLSPDEHPQYPSALCISKRALKRVGFMDEYYREPGFQDVDMGYQIADAGYYITCLPGKIIHWAERSGPLNEDNRDYLHAKWRIE